MYPKSKHEREAITSKKYFLGYTSTAYLSYLNPPAVIAELKHVTVSGGSARSGRMCHCGSKALSTNALRPKPSEISLGETDALPTLQLSHTDAVSVGTSVETQTPASTVLNLLEITRHGLFYYIYLKLRLSKSDTV